ncbi:6-O-methylguanine DNA methyltransferase [Leptolyngbya sp. 'hensonii']|uniref:methylated-DNA--[protein]-cysteine S-methyltransferase n=1 Tax=Leptolyngbya sp. 'hensonii' TaxID=1922337 RepID=UPI0009501AFB|nr:methylated-DNA--[protein]-cysteine S-methyltransferase [Leptolyngbya sp. 'hensonii']OLP19567.1 6-O-methylguanine DNA methyltransferase [Leptolyngbya sp. 'hensonii']
MNASIDPNPIRHEDYQRIARAISFMRQHHLQQPDLATVAQQVHLSASHFQRLFTQWAGISPKRFLQYLTVEYAKQRIAQSKNLLDLSLEAGLSSPGRLHDLFITLEAMSPGEVKARGAGLSIHYGIHPTPFGQALLALTPRGLCSLQFVDAGNGQQGEQMLRSEWPQAEISPNPEATQTLCDQIFQPRTISPARSLTLLVRGTNFQIQVWRALLQLPLGSLTTYQGLATLIDRPTAARAVGNAVGQNPIAYLIPCHRVLRQSAELGGYRWGLERKTAMLGWEASHLAQHLKDTPEETRI